MARSEHPLSRAICAAIVAGAIAYFGFHVALDRHAFGASMNAQQEAVALYLHWERRGFEPSIRSIGRALRDQDFKFRDADLQVWLKPFYEAAKKRAAAGPQAEAGGSDGHQDSLTPEADGSGGKQLAATRPRLRAHSKVSLVSDFLDDEDARAGGRITAAHGKDLALIAHAIAMDAGVTTSFKGEWVDANTEAATRLIRAHGRDAVGIIEQVVDAVAVGHLKPPRGFDLAYVLRLPNAGAGLPPRADARVDRDVPDFVDKTLSRLPS